MGLVKGVPGLGRLEPPGLLGVPGTGALEPPGLPGIPGTGALEPLGLPGAPGVPGPGALEPLGVPAPGPVLGVPGPGVPLVGPGLPEVGVPEAPGNPWMTILILSALAGMVEPLERSILAVPTPGQVCKKSSAPRRESLTSLCARFCCICGVKIGRAHV